MPATPSDVTATVISLDQINLSWTDNSEVEAGHIIERVVDGGSPELITVPGANITMYQDTDLLGTTATYAYRVRAYNSASESYNSNEAAVTVYYDPIETMIDDADAGITYTGDWNARSGLGGRYMDTTHESEDGGAVVELTFTGFEIQLIAEKQQWGGTADVYIDDMLELADVSFYNGGGQLLQQAIFTIGGLSYGEHTIRIEKSGGSWIYVDAFRVKHY